MCEVGKRGRIGSREVKLNRGTDAEKEQQEENENEVRQHPGGTSVNFG